jgi:hypothetical protein
MKEVILYKEPYYFITFYEDLSIQLKKSAKSKNRGGGVGAQHRYILMMTENPPEQLNQKCAKKLKVYTAHVAN